MTPSPNSTKPGVAYTSRTESLDTSSTCAKLVFHMFGALAGLAAACARARARARGSKSNRPRMLDARNVATGRGTLKDPKQTVTEVAEVLAVARSTFDRALASASSVASG